MSLDATVTIGDLVVIGSAFLALVSALVWYFGQRHFPTKSEVKQLRDHVDAQVAATRQDVTSAVGRIELFVTREIRGLTEIMNERHAALCDDIERVEKVVESTVVDAREARDTSRDARWQADMAKQMADQVRATIEVGMRRMEDLVGSLLARPRNPDQPERSR